VVDDCKRPSDVRSDAELAASIAAVKQALDDMHNGDTGIPLEEFDREFRNRNGLEPKG
jgi:hypothetical protein